MFYLEIAFYVFATIFFTMQNVNLVCLIEASDAVLKENGNVAINRNRKEEVCV